MLPRNLHVTESKLEIKVAYPKLMRNAGIENQLFNYKCYFIKLFCNISERMDHKHKERKYSPKSSRAIDFMTFQQTAQWVYLQLHSNPIFIAITMRSYPKKLYWHTENLLAQLSLFAGGYSFSVILSEVLTQNFEHLCYCQIFFSRFQLEKEENLTHKQLIS